MNDVDGEDGIYGVLSLVNLETGETEAKRTNGILARQ